MNENGGGTPNPLNQNYPAKNPFDASPSMPVATENAAQNIAQTNTPTKMTPVESTLIESTTAKTEGDTLGSLAETIVAESIAVPSLDPEGRPMQKVVEVAEKPKKKKKTGLIVGIILFLCLLIGGGITVAVLLLNNDNDPVSLAMKKIMSRQAPANLVIDGAINFEATNENSPISAVYIDLSSQAKTSSMMNRSRAEVSLLLFNDEILSFEFDEVYAANGDLYFKVDGISNLIDGLSNLTTVTDYPTNCEGGSDETNCIEDLTVETPTTECTEEDCTVEDVYAYEDGLDQFGLLAFSVISVADGQWLKISVDELNAVSGYATNSDMSCMVSMIDSINTNSNSAAELYNKNPFISSTTENITIDNRFNQVRKVVIDDKKFAEFVNSIQNSEMTNKLYNCLGWENNVKITDEDVAEITDQFSDVYVEVDKDNNFSRLYMQNTDDTWTITIDLAFSYPADINVSEPNEYVTFEDVIQEIMTSVFNLEDTTNTETEQQ